MDSLIQVNADFNTILEVYKKQELKLEEGQLLRDNLYTDLETIREEKNNLKQEVTDKEETLKKRKVEFYKFVKADLRGCELMNPEMEKLKESQKNISKLEIANSEKCKQQGAIVEKCREDLKKARKEFDSQNLALEKDTYKKKIEVLCAQNQNIQNTNLKKYEKVLYRSCPIVKAINDNMEKPTESLKDLKDQQKRSLALIQTIEEKKREML